MNKKYQQGATLIVVMLLLVAIIIIGTLAIRQGLVSLRIATNSQAQQLFLQNSDTGFFNTEKNENLIESFATNGMFGYMSNPEHKDKELVFCVIGTNEKFFKLKDASLIYWKTANEAPINNELGTKGYCKSSDSGGGYFTSGRKITITQVAVKFSSSTENDIFFGAKKGTDDETVKFEKAKPVKVLSVSIIPSLTSVDKKEIDKCLSNYMNEPTRPSDAVIGKTYDSDTSVTDCLETLGVPYSAYASHYTVAQDFVE